MNSFFIKIIVNDIGFVAGMMQNPDVISFLGLVSTNVHKGQCESKSSFIRVDIPLSFFFFGFICGRAFSRTQVNTAAILKYFPKYVLDPTCLFAEYSSLISSCRDILTKTQHVRKAT